MTLSFPSRRDAPAGSLVDFVLRRMQITTNLCSFQSMTDGYELKRRTVPDYNLIYVTEGKVVWVVEDQPHEMGPGTLVIVPPGVWHSGYSRTRRMTLGSLHVEATFAGGRDVFRMLNPARLQQVDPGGRLDQYLRGAMTEFTRTNDAHRHMMLRGWARLVVSELFIHGAEAGLLQPREVDPVVFAVLEELNRRMNRPVMLGELAELTGYSPQHLNRVFRRELGVTPLQYLARTRIELAADAIAEGRLTIKAIAEMFGFEDAYYFSRQFSRQMGMSPTAYRDAAMEGSENPSRHSGGPLSGRR